MVSGRHRTAKTGKNNHFIKNVPSSSACLSFSNLQLLTSIHLVSRPKPFTEQSSGFCTSFCELQSHQNPTSPSHNQRRRRSLCQQIRPQRFIAITHSRSVALSEQTRSFEFTADYDSSSNFRRSNHVNVSK
jgi:hypothetical protein